MGSVRSNVGSLFISSRVNADHTRDAITDSGPTGPGIFYARARAIGFSKS